MQLSLVTLFLSFAVTTIAVVMTFAPRVRPRIRMVGASLFVLAGSLFHTSANFRGFHYKSSKMRCSVQQIDQEGVWSRTWEGILIAGPAKQVRHVSVVNDAPANALREAMLNGRDVLVHYDEFRFRGWMLGSDVVVTHVEGI